MNKLYMNKKKQQYKKLRANTGVSKSYALSNSLSGKIPKQGLPKKNSIQVVSVTNNRSMLKKRNSCKVSPANKFKPKNVSLEDGSENIPSSSRA